MGIADLDAQPARMCALGGGELAGAKLARTAFFDEAGVGRPDEEPHVVVAGVVVNNDAQWKRLEDHLWWLVVDNFPRDQRDTAFFHAHAIYNGRTPFDEKNGWTPERRFDVLETLAAIPRDFKLPIIYAYQERAKYIANPSTWVKDATQAAQVVSSMICMVQTERYMREFIGKQEVAGLVFEDTQKVRRYVKEMCRFLRKPDDHFFTNPANEMMTQWLPLTHVVGSPHFEEKQDVSLLQVADVCAYVLKRKILNDPKIDRFFNPMRRQIAFSNDKDPTRPLYRPWDGMHD